MEKRGLFMISLAIGLSVLFSACTTIETQDTQVKSYTRLDKQASVAVIDVANRTKYGARTLSDAAAEILTSELLRSGNFIVVERQRLDEILKEMEIQVSDMADNDTAARVGKILNCTYLLTGTISNFGVSTEGVDMIVAKQKVQTVKTEVDIRMIKVETAQIVYSAYGQGITKKTITSGLGVGGSGGYDESLAGETLRIAMGNAVELLTKYLKANPR